MDRYSVSACVCVYMCVCVSQAGIISGNLGQEMARAVRNGGPGALWTGFLPFLIEALPYDMCELGSYSQLRDLWVHNTKPGGRYVAGCGTHVCAWYVCSAPSHMLAHYSC